MDQPTQKQKQKIELDWIGWAGKINKNCTARAFSEQNLYRMTGLNNYIECSGIFGATLNNYSVSETPIDRW